MICHKIGGTVYYCFARGVGKGKLAPFAVPMLKGSSICAGRSYLGVISKDVTEARYLQRQRVCGDIISVRITDKVLLTNVTVEVG